MNINILISSYDICGPVKGAFALANGLVNKKNKLNIFFIRGSKNDKLYVNEKIKVIYLDEIKSNLFSKIKFINSTLNNSNKIVISYGLSADFVNNFCLKNHIPISNVRANLYQNYKFHYGFLGHIIAKTHYYIIKRAKHIISMSNNMSEQIFNITGRNSILIGNFVDESNLSKLKTYNKNKKDNIKFVFIGSLSRRKNIVFLVDKFYELTKKYNNISLEIIGKGNMYKKIINAISTYKISHLVKVHGFKENPYDILINSDIFVLPSYSEGISRAALEALFFNKLCVMFNVDANNELIHDGFNGFLSDSEDDFLECLEKSMILSKRKNINLIPKNFQQELQITKINKFLKNECK